MAIEFFYAGVDPVVQAEAVDMLELCFDEWVDFRRQYGRKFPFIEHSFAAVESGRLLGHVGVMPLEISDGCGGYWKTAGLASVGVHPAARGRNIAHELCMLAAAWAEAEKFDLMLLYTASVRVYEKSSWQIIQAPACCMYSAPELRPVSDNWKSGADLSAAEKDFIRESYLALPPLTGRVRRSDDERFFHSWRWIFANPASRFKLTGHGYALQIEGVLCEAAAPEGEEYLPELLRDVNSAFLSCHDPAARFLQGNNFRSNSSIKDFTVWHGEVAMQKIFNSRVENQPLHLPLADKF